MLPAFAPLPSTYHSSLTTASLTSVSNRYRLAFTCLLQALVHAALFSFEFLQVFAVLRRFSQVHFQAFDFFTQIKLLSKPCSPFHSRIIF